MELFLFVSTNQNWFCYLEEINQIPIECEHSVHCNAQLINKVFGQTPLCKISKQGTSTWSCILFIICAMNLRQCLHQLRAFVDMYLTNNRSNAGGSQRFLFEMTTIFSGVQKIFHIYFAKCYENSDYAQDTRAIFRRQ